MATEWLNWLLDIIPDNEDNEYDEDSTHRDYYHPLDIEAPRTTIDSAGNTNRNNINNNADAAPDAVVKPEASHGDVSRWFLDRRLVPITGVLTCGTISVCVFFVMYSTWGTATAALSTSSVTFLSLLLGYVGSSLVRSLLLISLPAICGSRGKTIIWCVICGLLMKGPFKNMTLNVNEITRSMTCQGRMVIAKANKLIDAIQKPFVELARRFGRGIENMVNRGRVLKSELDKKLAPLKAAVNRLVELAKKFADFVEDCYSTLDRSWSRCMDMWDKAYEDCMYAMDDAADWWEERTSYLEERRRKRSSNKEAAHGKHSRVKRSIGDFLCMFANMKWTCSVIRVGQFVCSVTDTIKDIMFTVPDFVLDFFRDLEKEFDIEMRSTLNSSSGINSSKSFEQIKDDIKDEFEETTTVLGFIIDIFSKIMAASMLFVLISAFLYRLKYLKMKKFDNNYLTQKLFELDKAQVNLGEHSLFPLPKRLKKSYIHTTSIRLSAREKKSLMKGFIGLLIKLLIAGIFIMVDHGIYAILFSIRKHAVKSNIKSVGETKLDFEIDGGKDSAYAEMLRGMTDELNGMTIKNENDYKFSDCYAKPHKLDESKIHNILLLFVAFMLLILIKSYTLRLQHLILDMFHPDRQEERLRYMYIAIKRKKFCGLFGLGLGQVIVEEDKEAKKREEEEEKKREKEKGDHEGEKKVDEKEGHEGKKKEEETEKTEMK